MELDQFRILRELESHYQQISSLNNDLHEEEKRIPFIINQEKNKIKRQEELKEELAKLRDDVQIAEKKVIEQESRISKLEQSDQIISQEQLDKAALEKETLSAVIEIQQDIAISKLMDIDQLENESENIKGFLSGVEQTKINLEAEIEVNRKTITEKIAYFEKRIDNLFHQLPARAQSSFKILQTKYPGNTLSYIENDTCKKCHMSVNSSIEEEVESKNNFAQCTNCQRIFLPYRIFKTI